MGRHKGIAKTFYSTPELELAIAKRSQDTGETFSNLVRAGLAHVLGRPDLAEPPATGRPKKDAAPAPRKKASTRAGQVVTAKAPRKVPTRKRAAE